MPVRPRSFRFQLARKSTFPPDFRAPEVKHMYWNTKCNSKRKQDNVCVPDAKLVVCGPGVEHAYTCQEVFVETVFTAGRCAIGAVCRDRVVDCSILNSKMSDVD